MHTSGHSVTWTTSGGLDILETCLLSGFEHLRNPVGVILLPNVFRHSASFA